MSGIFGIIMPVFMTLGMIFINVFVNATDAFKFTTFSCIALIGPIISLFIIKEGKVEFVKKSGSSSFNEKITKVIPSPKKYPEFTWAWFSKFLLMKGYCTLMYIIPSVKVFFVAAIVSSLGYGCFGAVDTALVARILPNKEDTAKDFGIMNVANCIPQSLVPAIAPLVLAIGGWNFFFISLVMMPIVGMLTILPIPEVGHKLKSEREVEINISSGVVTKKE
jgi:MFS family permease